MRAAARQAAIGYVFGYGSLSADAGSAPLVATLADHVRVWGVAMDNRAEIGGYKYYVDADSGERPAVAVTFVDLVPSPGVDCVGVLLAVDAAALARLDARERNYERVEVGDRISVAADLGNAPVWTYRGLATARARYAAAAAAGTAVIASAYRETVEAGFRAAGLWERYVASTRPPQCPTRPLARVDLV